MWRHSPQEWPGLKATWPANSDLSSRDIGIGVRYIRAVGLRVGRKSASFVPRCRAKPAPDVVAHLFFLFDFPCQRPGA